VIPALEMVEPHIGLMLRRPQVSPKLSWLLQSPGESAVSLSSRHISIIVGRINPSSELSLLINIGSNLVRPSMLLLFQSRYRVDYRFRVASHGHRQHHQHHQQRCMQPSIGYVLLLYHTSATF
jgi:hypothetical protein